MTSAANPLPQSPSLTPDALASLRGRSVLLDFWNSSQAALRRTLPMLDRMARICAPRGLEVVGVTRDGAPGPVPGGLRVLQDPDGRLARRFQVGDQPTVVLLDPQGHERARFHADGRIPANEAALSAFLAGRIPALCEP